MVQSVKCLHEDLSLSPRTHEKTWPQTQSCNPSSGEAETGLLTYSASSRSQEESLSQKTHKEKYNSNYEDQPSLKPGNNYLFLFCCCNINILVKRNLQL